MNKRKVVFVVYFSMSSQLETLAREIIKGIERSGVNAKLFQVPETSSQRLLTTASTSKTTLDVPIIEPYQLTEADGIIFGVSAKFGMIPSQMQNFFDGCEKLKGMFTNKFVGTFFSTEKIGSGPESTALCMIPFFAHMVTIGGKSKSLNDWSQVNGGSNYGSGTITSQINKRKPSLIELNIAEEQGFDFGSIVRRQGEPISSLSF